RIRRGTVVTALRCKGKRDVAPNIRLDLLRGNQRGAGFTTLNLDDHKAGGEERATRHERDGFACGLLGFFQLADGSKFPAQPAPGAAVAWIDHYGLPQHRYRLLRVAERALHPAEAEARQAVGGGEVHRAPGFGV